MLRDYLTVAVLIFAINLLPAFGPPTSAVLVAFTLNFDLAPVPLVAAGAVAAATGRFVLATGTRRLRPRLSGKRRDSLAAAQRYLESNRARTAAGLGLFALSPVPSGQLFVAAGLMTVRLLPLTLSFFAGRLVSYTLYVSGAHALKGSVGDQALDGLTSPLGLALQALALVALVLLLRLDWVAILERRGPASPSPPPPPAQAARTPAVDLYWIPLGAGGHSVRLNGRVFEAIEADVAAPRALRPLSRGPRRRARGRALQHRDSAVARRRRVEPGRGRHRRRRKSPRSAGCACFATRSAAGREDRSPTWVRRWEGPAGSPRDAAGRAPDSRAGASRAPTGLGPRRAGGGRDVELELRDRMAARQRRCADRFPATAATRPGARMVRRSRGGSARRHLRAGPARVRRAG